jgi:Alpha/beta hydrolase domain
MKNRQMTYACTLAALLLAFRAAPVAAVADPTVTGPIAGAPTLLSSTTFDLAPLGYVQEEYFLEGTATSYTSATPLSTDGAWVATPGPTAAYKTRVVVRRPTTNAQFNGAVVVEWLNVSGGLDADPDWLFTHAYLLREGYASVAVSAQFVGVEGGSSPLGLNLSLKAVNPARYGTLVHPGDSFSYDIYSQVAQALRHPIGAGIMGGLPVERILATGESQSAFRMVTYVNAVHPIVGLYDGFLIHSRSGGAAPLAQSPQTPVGAPTPSFIRTDVDVPVLTFQTETDVTALGSHAIRQPDTAQIRLWEVAGTAHGDMYQLGIGLTDPGPTPIDVTHLSAPSAVFGGIITCARPINSGPQQYILSAAVARLDRWVRTGRAPRSQPLLDTVAGPPVALVLDALGNATGGIRTPPLDVPIAVRSGLGQTGGSFCFLFGTTTPFTPATLATLYPTHDRYVSLVRRASRAAVRRGVLLRPDARALRLSAAASTIGN